MSYDFSNSLHGLLSKVVKSHFCYLHSLLGENDLHPGQPPLLIALYNKDGQSQRELAKVINIKPATINVMVSRLEKMNFVKKEQDTYDQRISRIFLTEKGYEVIKKISNSLEYLDDICLKDFTVQDEITLRKLLTKLKNNLENNCNAND